MRKRIGVKPMSQESVQKPEGEPSIRATVGDHAVFVAVTMLYWTALYIYVPILTPYLEFRGVSLSSIGLVLGSYGFMQILVRLPLGIYSDKLRRRKPFIMLGLLTAALSCFLFTWEGTWMWALAGRVVSGISASTWVAFTVLYASYYVKNDATRAMGNISLITVAGQLVGMAASGWLADRWSWNGAFHTGILIGVLGLVVAFFIKEPKEGVDREPIRLQDLGSVVRSPVLLFASGLSILAQSVLFITMFGFTPLQATVLGAGNRELTLLVFAFMIPHAISNYTSGKWIAPRLGVGNTMTLSFAVSAICTLVIPFVPSFSWLLATQIIGGFAQGLHFPLLLGLSIQDIKPSKRATAMGFYQAVYSIGMFAGPFLAGWMNEAAGLSSGFYLGSAAAAAAAFLTLYGKSRRSIGPSL